MTRSVRIRNNAPFVVLHNSRDEYVSSRIVRSLLNGRARTFSQKEKIERFKRGLAAARKKKRRLHTEAQIWILDSDTMEITVKFIGGPEMKIVVPRNASVNDVRDALAGQGVYTCESISFGPGKTVLPNMRDPSNMPDPTRTVGDYIEPGGTLFYYGLLRRYVT